MQNVVPESGNIKPLAGPRPLYLIAQTNKPAPSKHNSSYLTSQNGYLKLFCAPIISRL